MDNVGLLKIIEKFKLENLVPEVDPTQILVTQPDVNAGSAACRLL